MRRVSSAFAAITVSLVVGSALVGVSAAPAATLPAEVQVATHDGHQAASSRSLPVQPRVVASSPIFGSLSPLGTGIGSTVYSLAVSPSGTLYAGGNFSTAGSLPANNIAAWNGAAWSTLSTGVNDDVRALAYAVQGNTLYAGGWFSTAGGASASRIAAWNGATWSPLGAGTNGSVSSLTLDPQDGTLYAGGTFLTAGGPAANNIATWNGTAWSPLGPGVGSTVNALALDAQDDTLYAGGSFTTAGGPAANYVAAWNGTAWSPLGPGVGSTVNTLAVDAQDDSLYVGGTFTTAGGLPASRIAAWNGTAWSPLGAGLDNDVVALKLDSGRDLLYAGGTFSTAGAGSASKVAVWDAGITAWIPLRWGASASDNGVANTVRAFALDDSTLYLGGSFINAGGNTAGDFIAKWTWDEPSGSLSATSGDPGTTVDIEGWGLIGVTGVTFSGTDATSYTRDDSTTISNIVVPSTPGTYTVRVKAVGSTSAAGTIVGSFTVNNVNPPTPPPTYPPGSPTNVVATAGDKSATVTWTPPTDTGSFPVTNYQVQSSPDGKTCLVAAPALTCTVTGLTAGTDYRFRAQALNGAGWGPWSDYSTPVTPVTPLIYIIDSRRGTGADARRVYANGTTAGLTSTTLQPRFRFPGQTSFSYGYPLPLNESEGFTWSRTTGKTIYLYFEADGVRSNQVVIAAR